MALPSTMYTFEIDLSDTDRGVYKVLKFSAAQHPTETGEYLAARVLAYCLEYEDGITFTKGLSASEEPALWIRHLDGRIKCWVEIGSPAAQRLHRAAKLAERVAVYSHRSPVEYLAMLAREKIHRGGELPVYSFEPGFLRGLAECLERRNEITISVNEQQLYLEIKERNLSSPIEMRRAVADVIS